jgi:ribonuclease BN (tRNA processing enzyme)
MEINILGAHNIESKDTGLVTLLIDDALAIDAGALTSRLSINAQLKLKAILLTHQHYDHIRDIPIIGMNAFMHRKSLNVYGTRAVYDVLAAHFLNSAVYSNFLENPEGNPTIKYKILEPGSDETVGGYNVLPVPVKHSQPTVGFLVTSPQGDKMFYTSDTGPGLEEVWQQVEPQLLIIEVTASNKYEEAAIERKHLTPSLLGKELASFRGIRGYIPRVFTVHMNPAEDNQIAKELAETAAELKAEITPAREGMRIRV